MHTLYERTYSYTVTIAGKGTVRLGATDKWHACELAYAQYMHIEKDRKKYTAVLTYKPKRNGTKKSFSNCSRSYSHQ